MAAVIFLYCIAILLINLCDPAKALKIRRSAHDANAADALLKGRRMPISALQNVAMRPPPATSSAQNFQAGLRAHKLQNY
jgi:hypothetical protein